MVAVAQSWLEHPVVAREVGGSIPLSHPNNTLVAQLDRALGFDPSGYRFESCRGYNNTLGG